MLFAKIGKIMAITAGAMMMLSAGVVAGQSTKSMKAEPTKSAAQEMPLKQQTTCPVSGNAIDRNQYVDHNGKRIYVCSPNHVAQVRKNPEKYLTMLEKKGQSVEGVGNATPTESRENMAGMSEKPMAVKDHTMAADTANKAAETGYWTCPMHLEIHNTQSGSCPICGMNLVYKKNGKKSSK